MTIRLLALCAVLGSGCTCGIALCNVDSDCGPGGTCDLSTGVCVSEGGLGGGAGGGAGGGSGGGTASSGLTIRVPALAPRPDVSGTVYDDAPSAFRRGDQLFIWLEASRPLSAPALKVEGVDAVAIGAAACTHACFGNCYCFAADLSKPPLPGLRGAFALAASGVDPEGKTVTATDSINVTRLAWRRPLGQPVRATPAIGSDGTVYVGTAASGPSRQGSLFAIGAGGQEKWNKSLGRIEASVTLAPPGPTPQRMFVGSVSTNGMVTALDATGAEVGQCMLSKDADLAASPAAIANGAAFYANRTQELIAFRPSLNPACEVRQATEDVIFPDSLVASGGSVFFVNDKPNVYRFDLGGSGWVEYNQNQWPGTPFSTYRNRGLALPIAGKLVGAGQMMNGGTVFQAAVGNSFKFDYGFFPPRVSATASGPVVTSDGTVLVGIPTGIAAVASGSATQVGLGDPIANSPALGQGGRLYALAENGGLSEWTYAGGKPLRSWTAPLEGGAAPAFEASPALDCARTPTGVLIPGRPGILYAAARSGMLYAITVDARGIDATAQWPKYQKDPRNSGTADTALQEFACP